MEEYELYEGGGKGPSSSSGLLRGPDNKYCYGKLSKGQFIGLIVCFILGKNNFHFHFHFHFHFFISLLFFIYSRSLFSFFLSLHNEY